MATFVCTASIYVTTEKDGEEGMKEATSLVDTLNESEIGLLTGDNAVSIRLPDNVLLGPDSWDEGDYTWEVVQTTAEEQ